MAGALAQPSKKGRSDLYVSKPVLGAILVDFLRDPRRQAVFSQLYDHSCTALVCYLGSLRRRRYRLPLENTDPPNAMKNLAIDILGSFFASYSRAPFCVILDFFASKGIHSDNSVSADQLAETYLWLLRGFTLREIGKLHAEDDPQLARFKRRVYESLDNQKLYCLEWSGGIRFLSRAALNVADLASGQPIPPNELAAIVEQSFLESHSVEVWCRALLEKITRQRDYLPCVQESELLAAMIRVYAKYIVEEAPIPSPAERQTQVLLHEQFEIEMAATLEWLKGSELARIVARGKLLEVSAAQYVLAAEHYIRDMILGGSIHPGSLGSYFRLVMPADTLAEYVKKHKTLFESILRRAAHDFIDRTRKNSTIRALRHYGS